MQQTNTQETVQLKVDVENLMRNLRYAFSNKSSVLGELMQNARRAKATKIEFTLEGNVLTVVDDGIGISNMQDLLTVASSGWDKATQAVEKPYGMGWLSCLFSAEHVTVESRGKKLGFNTKDAIGFSALHVQESKEKSLSGTRLVLTGFDMKENTVEVKLKEKAEGFPIQVWFNGALMENPHALEKLVTSFTSVGHVFVQGVHDNKKIDCSPSIRAYLQGLPIWESYHHREPDVIVHLDSQRFFGEMPDRNRLVDEDEVKQEIKDAIKTVVRDKLESDRATMSDGAWLDKYWEVMAYADCLHLSNDIPLIPVRLFTKVESEAPEIDQYNDPYSSVELVRHSQHIVDGCFTRDAIQLGALRLLNLPEPDENSYGYGAAFQLAAALDAVVVYSTDIPDYHWVNEHIISLDLEDHENAKYSINVINEVAKGTFCGDWETYGEVVIAKGVHIRFEYEGKNGPIALDADAVSSFVFKEEVEQSSKGRTYLSENVTYYILQNEDGSTSSYDLPRMVEDFIGEFDDFQEGDCEEECGNFQRYVNSLISKSPAETMNSLLEKIRWDIHAIEQLHNTQFTLSVNAKGEFKLKETKRKGKK